MFLPSSSKQTGFSLIEVLVTAAIIGLVTAILVVRYGAFNSSTILKGQAYEIALDIREAQVFAISVRVNSEGSNLQFRESYGMYFEKDKPNQYHLFLDKNNNIKFNPNESLVSNTIDNRLEIRNIYAADTCVHDQGRVVRDVSITFKRPDFDAEFVATNNGDNSKLNTNNNSVCIAVGSTDGGLEQRGIIVSKTGQITVE